jgi:hypothetical protein
LSEQPTPIVWRRSSYCEAGTCVEVARLDSAAVAVRDSCDPNLRLVFGRAEWAAFVAGVRAGEFEFN